MVWMRLYTSNRGNGFGSGQQMITAPAAVDSAVIKDVPDRNAASPALAAASAVSPETPGASALGLPPAPAHVLETKVEALSSATVSTVSSVEGRIPPPNTPNTLASGDEEVLSGQAEGARGEGASDEDGDGEEAEEEKVVKLASGEAEADDKANVEANMG